MLVTLLAAGLVASLHLGIGLVVARAYFVLPLNEIPDEAISVTTLRPPPPNLTVPPHGSTPAALRCL